MADRAGKGGEEKLNTGLGRRRGFSRVLCVSVFSVGLFFFLIEDANAHGCGRTVIANQQIDNTIATVCHFPFPPQTGTNHITVALSDVTTEQAILNRPITITTTDGNQTITHTATHDNAANRLLYEADFRIRDAGTWDFAVEIEGGDEVLRFTADIEPAPLISADTIILITIIIAVVILYFLTKNTK